MRSFPFVIACVLGFLLRVSPTLAEEEKPAMIEEGSRVSIEYTLKLDDGSTADTNVGEEPLVYQQGSHQILPGLERALAGMQVDEQREVTLPAKDGYGSVDPELYQEVDAELIPEDAREAGTRLVSQDPSGNRRIVRVHEVKGDRIVVDLNHPLAGQTLHFDVKVLGIE